MSKKHKEYLGDAIYADWDGMHVILTTGDGIYESDRILLNEDVFKKLTNYYETKRDESGRSSEGEPGHN